MTEVADIIVVGAGFAGLVAARDLGQGGATVVVLEARDRIGGRAYHAAFPAAGRSVELGGAWFDADWQTPMREEAERYGVEIADATPYQTTRWFTGGEESGLRFPGGAAGARHPGECLATTAAIAGGGLRFSLRVDVADVRRAPGPSSDVVDAGADRPPRQCLCLLR